MATGLEKAPIAVLIISLMLLFKKNKGKKRSIWVKPWLTRRDNRGIYNNLVKELRLEDGEG